DANRRTEPDTYEHAIGNRDSHVDTHALSLDTHLAVQGAHAVRSPGHRPRAVCRRHALRDWRILWHRPDGRSLRPVDQYMVRAGADADWARTHWGGARPGRQDL